MNLKPYLMKELSIIYKQAIYNINNKDTTGKHSAGKIFLDKYNRNCLEVFWKSQKFVNVFNKKEDVQHLGDVGHL